MAMVLDKVVPFGRSMDEYIKIFNLTDADLNKKIIGIGDGPASFNSEMTRQGKSVVSVDPLYQFSGDEILQRFNEVVDNIINQVKATSKDWVWGYHKSPDDLRRNRVKVIKEFLSDYENGKKINRYIVDEFPKLEFKDQEFDIALCSHLLFLYSDHLDYNFHLNSIGEMLRIAKEIRIFPLITLMWKHSQHLDEIVKHYTSMGYKIDIENVEYELQPGGNKMLKITRDV
ncbi:SAM-dependent methyltransferase [Nostoc sp. ATCC 53789]|uniref:SAM-dependent methyltransferase n=1 Tax=Nostoc sp. ATCC 53789 TaxID=76335 RepID=UPI000DEC0D5A|nr:SAM-dependent methyltransferase [Nostoc sp. ATCC 53789]MBD2510236.1 SAM-dependent methyltransferase [Desmonostoc muscorum FACHB-395]QHG17235.1 SAM-dependent methyltransferase [Nostoc sp. ATCC 53789]RCJ25936.1 SAM-dependent methyltransferase [Nostoc sp. ATCC 53789]